MNFDDFVGLDAQRARLKEGVQDGMSVHAYLFCGAAGSGKRSMAAVLARAMNCLSDAGKPCDRCASCVKYLANTHPDRIDLRPAEKKSIGVAEIRDLLERIARKPYEGRFHTIVIEQAHSLTAQAQNALLKTLEEPPASARFILLAETTASLLPTILSRVRLVRFAPLTDESVVRALIAKGIPAARAAELAMHAYGSIGRALALEEDKAYWKMRERVCGALDMLSSRADVGVAAMTLQEDKDRAREVLAILEEIGRSRMRAEVGLDTIDAKDEQKKSSIAGDRIMRAAMDARRMLESNVAWSAVAETLFFKLVS